MKDIKKFTFTFVSLGVIVALWTLGMNASTESETFVQDRFAIGFWVDPPADENIDRHYADIAAADFTMVIGGFGAKTPETVQKQIKICEKYDLKAIVATAGLPPTQLPESPAVWGYGIRDEPNVSHFPNCKRQWLRYAMPDRDDFRTSTCFPTTQEKSCWGRRPTTSTLEGSLKKWALTF